MAHHKRKGPKSTRAGCLLCHPQKHQAEDRRTVQERRADQDRIADFILERWEGTLRKLAEDD